MARPSQGLAWGHLGHHPSFPTKLSPFTANRTAESYCHSPEHLIAVSLLLILSFVPFPETHSHASIFSFLHFSLPQTITASFLSSFSPRPPHFPPCFLPHSPSSLPTPPPKSTLPSLPRLYLAQSWRFRKALLELALVFRVCQCFHERLSWDEFISELFPFLSSQALG